HPFGHESLGVRGYPIVLFRNEIPRGNRFPPGSSGWLLQCGTRYWPLGYSHHLRHISWCVCAERLAKLVSLDVQLWPADRARRPPPPGAASSARWHVFSPTGAGHGSGTPATLLPTSSPVPARKTIAHTLFSSAAA